MTIKEQSFSVDTILTTTLTQKDLAEVANWISRTGELPKISGNTGHHLTFTELQGWFDTCIQAVVVKHNNIVIGIATLTVNEAELPGDTAEICHCIVHPKFRRLYNGSSIILSLTAFAKQNGFKRVVGRVATNNPIGETLLKYLHWEKITHNYSYDNRVVWLEKKFI